MFLFSELCPPPPPPPPPPPQNYILDELGVLIQMSFSLEFNVALRHMLSVVAEIQGPDAAVHEVRKRKRSSVHVGMTAITFYFHMR